MTTMLKPLRDDVYRLVDCPKCGRKAGERCYTIRSQSEAGYQFPTVEPHVARMKAYTKLREVSDN
jgi:hypothetical protein